MLGGVAWRRMCMNARIRHQAVLHLHPHVRTALLAEHRRDYAGLGVEVEVRLAHDDVEPAGQVELELRAVVAVEPVAPDVGPPQRQDQVTLAVLVELDDELLDEGLRALLARLGVTESALGRADRQGDLLDVPLGGNLDTQVHVAVLEVLRGEGDLDLRLLHLRALRLVPVLVPLAALGAVARARLGDHLGRTRGDDHLHADPRAVLHCRSRPRGALRRRLRAGVGLVALRRRRRTGLRLTAGRRRRTAVRFVAGRWRRRSRAVDPEGLVLLRLLAELELEVVPLLVDWRVAVGTSVRDERLDVDDVDDLRAALALVVVPGRAVGLLLLPARLPAVDGVGPGSVGHAVAPQVDVGAVEVRILLMAGARGLTDVLGPHVAAVALAATRGLGHGHEHQHAREQRADEHEHRAI